jgi:GPH family glycoside/pentoside/hexuronide:cation symporter
MSPSVTEASRVPWLSRLAYSLGNVGETLLSRSFELFVLFYYTQVLGLSGTLAGIAILLAMIADAVTDPLVGALSDGLKSRWGRRHTLMFLSALPSALFFVALFYPPAGLPAAGLVAWLAFTAIGLRVSVTFFHIPWSTQIAELSDDPRERVTLAVLRNIFAAVASFVLIAVAFDLFFVSTEEYPRGQENPANYASFALSIGAALLLVILLSAAGTYRRIRAREGSVAPGPRFRLSALWPAWQEMIFRFKNFRCLFLGSLFILTAFSMYNSMALYLGSYFWDLSGDQIKTWQFAVILGAAVTLIIGKPVVDRLPHPLLFAGGIGFSVVLFALPILLRLSGMVAVGSDVVMPLLQVSNGLAGVSLGVVMIVSAVIASETSDDYQSRTGVNATALLFGFVFLAMKTASGFGKLLAGLIIDVIALPTAENADLITASQLDGLGWWSASTLLVLGACGVISFSGYRSIRAKPGAHWRHAEEGSGAA